MEIGGTARSSRSGQAVAYMSFGSPDSAVSRGYYNEFRSSRAAVGWSTVGINPPMDTFAGINTLPSFEFISADVDHGVGASWGSTELGHPQMINLWHYDAATESFGLLSQPSVDPFVPELPTAATSGNHFVGASDDFSHVVFVSSRALVPEAPSEVGGRRYLYEWADGDVRLVGLLPDDENNEFVSGAVLGYGTPTTPGNPVYPGDNAISVDGSHIYFTTSASPADSDRELYLRVDDQADPAPPVSVHVSASERTDCANDPTCGSDNVPNPAPDPVATGAQFQLASPNGDEAFFTSPAKLTNDATAVNGGGLGPIGGIDNCANVRCDLYKWTAGAPQGERLEDLTTGDLDGAGVLATVGASIDATSIYFVAIGDLAEGAVEGEPNLYLWQDGKDIRFIATLDGLVDEKSRSGDEGVWSRTVSTADAAGDHRFSGARVTPDGRYLLFRSRAQLLGHENTGEYQLYRYDAITTTLACISCSAYSDGATGQSFLNRQRIAVFRPPWLSRNLSEDGHRVFFDSSKALVPQDTNGKIDVYEWQDDGAIRLISSGRSSEDSALIDASASGNDVFFTTREQLVKSDADAFVDLYDARIGGGFPDVSVQPECQGDGCQGTPSSPPVLAQSGTDRAQKGDAPVKKQKPSHKCRRGFRRVKNARGKARCVRKNTIRRHRRVSGRGR